ncbi:4908_t:CDS:2, partial [Entrophospora sp. SA101]
MFRNSLLLLFGTAIYLLALSPIAIEAQRPGYPPVDTPPPPVAAWTALVDSSKVPNAPVRKVGDPCDPKDPFCYWSCTNCVKNETDVKICPQKGDWGITYDDGPSPFTPTILDYLGSKGLKATFFVIGSRATNHPDVLLRASKEGHQIGIHTWSHTSLTTQTNEVIIAELKWTEKIIKEITGLTPKYMRPPRGDYDDRVRNIAKQLGYKSVIWDHDTFDWMSQQDPTYDLNWIPANFTQWVNEASTTGHVSLEHDLYQQTVGKAPKAIDIVIGAGFKIKTIANCTNELPYLE